MKTDQLLHTLTTQFARLDADVAPIAQHATLRARFDRQLFTTQSALLQACLDEVRTNLQALHYAVEHQRFAQVQWLTARLAAQIEAIARESQSWSLRCWDSASPAVTRWQRRRVQHQEYERRLQAMTTERERLLAQATTFDEQQRLSRETEAFAARLARCRTALEKIETVLARMTR